MKTRSFKKYELVHVNTGCIKKKDVYMQEQHYLINLKIGFTKSAKQKKNKPQLQKSLQPDEL